MEAELRRPAKARRALRVHPLCLLLDIVPELLVELRTLSRSGRAVAGATLDRGLARRSDRRAARRPGRSVPALPLPHHHELRQGLPEAPQSGESHRRNQAGAGRTAGVSVVPGPSEARSPESTITIREYGFRTRRCAAIRNDES